jgi:hypothetical protein
LALNREAEMATRNDPPRQPAGSGLGRSAANLERRSRLRLLDDLLEALEALNLEDAPILSAAVAKRLDELGIPRAPTGAPFTKLIEGVLAAQEPFMIHLPTDLRPKFTRVPFDPRRLRY